MLEHINSTILCICIWYDENGNAEHDRDYNHPGNMDFPHDHEWKNGERGTDHLPLSPMYKIDWRSLGKMIGAGITLGCIFLNDVYMFDFSDDYMAPEYARQIWDYAKNVFG